MMKSEQAKVKEQAIDRAIDTIINTAISERTEIRVWDDTQKRNLTGYIVGNKLKFPVLRLPDGRTFEFSRKALHSALINQTVLRI